MNRVSEAKEQLQKLIEEGTADSSAEVELLRQRDRLVRLERLLDTGLMLLSKDGEVRLANERAAEMLGLGDRDWSALAPQLEGLVEAARSGEETCEVVLELTARALRATVTSCEDGAFRLVELRDDDALAGVEKDLMRAAQVRNLRRLYVGLAHDLRAPLNAVTLHLELLHRQLEGEEGGAPVEDKPEPVERLRIVEKELQRLQVVLDRLLDQAVPKATERGTFDLREVIGELGALLGAPARQSGKRVDVELGEREMFVDARRDHVKQALLNVAVNGLEAMTEGGVLRMVVFNREDRVRVEVSDDGPGVPEEIRERLFDIYVTGKEEGVGAGLYFARSLMEAQDGGLELASTSSRGTTFAAELPIRKA